MIALATASAEQGLLAERIIGGLNRPIHATFAPGDPGALYVVEQRNGGFGADLNNGTISRLDLSTGTTTPFMNVSGLDTDSQGGIHSLAFHPDYQPGIPGSKLYIVALEPSAIGTPGISDSTLQEWVLDAGGNPTYNRQILRIPGLQSGDATHAMDWIGFKPGATGDERDWLYVTQGDGGIQAGGGGFVNNPQDLSSLYGKVLRLGVGGGDDLPVDNTRNYEFTPTLYNGDPDMFSAPEVFYSGVRNPWRMSFDRDTGDIWLGDVGAGSWEELNYIEGGVLGRDAGGTPASPGDGAAYGIDFGWARREGLVQGPGPTGGGIDPDGALGPRPDSVQPIAVFSHGGADPNLSITGGYVYRGPDQNPAIQGKYIWSDFWYGKTYVGAFDGGGNFLYDNATDQLAASLAPAGQFINRVSSYAEDTDGNLYLIDFGVAGCGGGCSSETGWGGARVQFGTGEIYKLSYGALPEPPPEMVREPVLTQRDDFDSNHNYADGNVPAGGIWDGVHNADFGDTFDANSTNSDQLTIGLEPVGWDMGGQNAGPFVFQEVNAENLMEVRAKITSQSQGNWGMAGILVREPGPIDTDPSNDNFLTAHSFRGTGNPEFRMQIASYIDGGEIQSEEQVTDPNDLMFIRLVHDGMGQYTAYSSSDGENWIQRGDTATNPNLAAGLVEVGLWAGTLNGGVSTGIVEFDWVEIQLGVPAGGYNDDGKIGPGDYTLWRNTLGETVDPWSGADGDGDGMITDNDYFVWKTNYGKIIPNLEAGAGSAVPEPTTGALFVVALALASCCCSRRRQWI